MQKLLTTVAFLLMFGLFSQVHAGDNESEWTELTIEEFEELVLGNTLKGRSSRDNARYVEYWKKDGKKIQGVWSTGGADGGDYSSRWKQGEDNCIMYHTANGYECWKMIQNKDGDLKWKRGYGFGDTLDVTILKGKRLGNDALFAND
jgi:hypothetical protein